MTLKVFVAGATGATGRLVVQMLLEDGQKVRVVVRSRARMLQALQTDNFNTDCLEIMEASLLDLTDDQLKEQLQDCDATVSCLGHNQNLRGVYGHPRHLVTDATRRLTDAMLKDSTVAKPKRFILLTGESVSNPNGQDGDRTLLERSVMSMVRFLVPPFQDNVDAVLHLFNNFPADDSSLRLEWSVVRPAQLINGEVSSWQVYEKPQGSLFSGNTSTRANVARFMVDLVLEEQVWEEWKFKMPILHDASQEREAGA